VRHAKAAFFSREKMNFLGNGSSRQGGLKPETFFSANQHFFDDNFFL
jgi:hypothetical protein